MQKSLLIKLLKRIRQKATRGQGMVETALFFPVVLLILSGLVEFGFMLNHYLTLQDAIRNAARFASDGQFLSRDSDPNCEATMDFYRQTACLVNQELEQERPEIELNIGNGQDDIVISVFSITSGVNPEVTARFPDDCAGCPAAGWSEALDAMGYGTRNQSSYFTEEEIEAELNPTAPHTGFILVEAFYSYSQIMKLPWITAIVDDPYLLHVYTLMPLTSAEPVIP